MLNPPRLAICWRKHHSCVALNQYSSFFDVFYSRALLLMNLPTSHVLAWLFVVLIPLQLHDLFTCTLKRSVSSLRERKYSVRFIFKYKSQCSTKDPDRNTKSVEVKNTEYCKAAAAWHWTEKIDPLLVSSFFLILSRFPPSSPALPLLAILQLFCTSTRLPANSIYALYILGYEAHYIISCIHTNRNDLWIKAQISHTGVQTSIVMWPA